MGSFVLQQRNALKCCTCCRSSQGLTFVFCQCWRQFPPPFFQKPKFLLHGENSTNAQVDAAFRDLAFFHEFFQKNRKFQVLRHHAHVNPCQNRHSDGFFVRGRHTMPFHQIFDVLPICHDQSLKTKLTTKDVCQHEAIDVRWNAIHLPTVYHHSHRTRVDGLLKRW